ncbi:SIS domain-containing protein [Brevundimonas vesicularis]|uniref:D-sedoheptulose-7-phosphate isomerase n=1 Tax=Brevundimonas vesicularis TaxID=41276 RepID=UPI001572DC7D|nr:SIS domain-containing protein [Brevundimonas vesicularis]NSX34140.1 SIS domain-containing protein [Brevundimonas vesicularis]
MNYFPNKTYQDAGVFADDYFVEVKRSHESVSREALRSAAELVCDTISSDRDIFACGNGGSAAIANHLLCDCLKGVSMDTQLRPRVHTLSSTVELITAIANDFSFEEVFSFPLISLSRPGDLLIVISSSGNSPNIVKALRVAKKLNVKTIAITGFDGGAASAMADISLHVDSSNYGVIEDVHQSIMHIIAQYTRNSALLNPGVLGSLKF